MKQIETKIPFAGYYESLYSGLIDDLIDQDNMNDAGDLPENDSYLWKYDHKAIEDQLNQIYVEEFEELFNETCDLDIKLTYKNMESPRGYNFGTDRLFCDISSVDLTKVYDAVNQKDLADVIKQRFTSYDGFISFYSNDVVEWLEKPLDDYDHNEIETLLMAALQSVTNGEYLEKYTFESDLYDKVHERACCNGELDLVQETAQAS